MYLQNWAGLKFLLPFAVIFFNVLTQCNQGKCLTHKKEIKLLTKSRHLISP